MRFAATGGVLDQQRLVLGGFGDLAAEAGRRRAASWTELRTRAPRTALYGAVEYVVGRVGGRAVEEFLGTARLDRALRRRLDPHGPARLDQAGVHALLEQMDDAAAHDHALDRLADAFGVSRARFRALAADPSTGGATNPGTAKEAVAVLRLEQRGELPGPVVRDPRVPATTSTPPRSCGTSRASGPPCRDAVARSSWRPPSATWSGSCPAG